MGRSSKQTNKQTIDNVMLFLVHIQTYTKETKLTEILRCISTLMIEYFKKKVWNHIYKLLQKF